MNESIMQFICGTYSSVSSSLSGSAAQCWEDILKGKLSGMQEHRKAIVNKMLGKSFDVLYCIMKLCGIFDRHSVQTLFSFIQKLHTGLWQFID